MTEISQEDPKQRELQELLAASDAYSTALYPEEGRHPVDVGYLSSSSVRFFVARLNERAVGCVALVIAADGTAELKRMIVLSECRGRGVGSRLIQHVEAARRRRGRPYPQTGNRPPQSRGSEPLSASWLPGTRTFWVIQSRTAQRLHAKVSLKFVYSYGLQYHPSRSLRCRLCNPASDRVGYSLRRSCSCRA
jgi:GNAT superfamily N-acetyltransferase